MGHKSDVLRFLQLIDSQSRSWGLARMNEEAGVGPSGPASSAATARS